MTPAERSDWLPLAEAAARLGVSRLKLREAVAKGLIPARTDNEGRRRVDLSAAPDDLRAAVSGVTAEPASLISALFDEIEELQGELSDRTATVARFADLAGRQQDALEAAAAALERSQAETARLAGLLDRSLDLAAALEDRPADPVAGRALALLEETAAALEESRGEAQRLSGLVARAVDLADRAAQRAGTSAPGLEQAAGKALALLDSTTAELEKSRAEAAKATDLLGRATAAAARLEAEAGRLATENGRLKGENARLSDENRAQTGLISAQEGMVDKLFSLSEAALDTAARRPGAPKRGLIDRVFGRKSGLSG